MTDSPIDFASLPEVVDLLTFLYGRRPVPFQTLDFCTGTHQELHSDEFHFDSLPPRFMCGVWIALEPIGLAEEGLGGHMVSTAGQLDLRYVPFRELVNPETLKTEVRFIQRGSDFQRLARELETRLPPKT